MSWITRTCRARGEQAALCLDCLDTESCRASSRAETLRTRHCSGGCRSKLPAWRYRACKAMQSKDGANIVCIVPKQSTLSTSIQTYPSLKQLHKNSQLHARHLPKLLPGDFPGFTISMHPALANFQGVLEPTHLALPWANRG